MEVLIRSCARSSPYPLVRGVRAIFVKVCITPVSAGTTKYCSHLFTFNLSQRGRNALPLCEGDGTDRKALFKNTRKFLLQGDEGEAG